MIVVMMMIMVGSSSSTNNRLGNVVRGMMDDYTVLRCLVMNLIMTMMVLI